jgi:uncharacterized membrane protein
MLALFRLLHVAVGFWFVAGLVGRTYTLREAKKSAEIAVVAKLAALAGKFDRYLVVPGSQAVLAFGLITAWIGGYPLLGALQGARSNWLFTALLLFAGSVVLVPTVFIPSGKAFDQALRAAVADGRVTPQLTLALTRPGVAWAHRLELAVVAAIVVLMVTKPF